MSQGQHLNITVYLNPADYSTKPIMSMSHLLYLVMSSSGGCWVIFHQPQWEYLVVKGSDLISAEVEGGSMVKTLPLLIHSDNRFSSLDDFSIPAQACCSASLQLTPHLRLTCHLQTPSVLAFDVVFTLMYSRVNHTPWESDVEFHTMGPLVCVV